MHFVNWATGAELSGSGRAKGAASLVANVLLPPNYSPPPPLPGMNIPCLYANLRSYIFTREWRALIFCEVCIPYSRHTLLEKGGSLAVPTVGTCKCSLNASK